MRAHATRYGWSLLSVLVIGCGANLSTADGDGAGAGEPLPDNPSECPGDPPGSGNVCRFFELLCTYQEQDCTVTYQCKSNRSWAAIEAECDQPTVDCDAALEGERCALTGETCWTELDACTEEERYCGRDHTWSIESLTDECCAGSCCDVTDCPETAPLDGDQCDPCVDTLQCEYPVDTECGPSTAHASCASEDGYWRVDPPVCEPPQPG